MSIGSNVNPNYPIPGVDQSSRGFRDNFAIIKRELESLQGKTIQLTGDVQSSPIQLGAGDGPVVIPVTALVTGNITAGGANHSVQYNHAGILAGASNVFFDPTFQRLGVGTNTPAALLDVSGPARIVDSLFLTSGSNHTSIGSADISSLAIQTNSTPAITIDSSQRVGIGTSTPSHPLDVVTSAANIAEFLSTSPNSAIRVVALSSGSASMIVDSVAGDIAGGMSIDNSGVLSLHTGELTGGNLTGSTQFVSITPAGRMGINTVPSSYMLDVNGSFRSSGINDNSVSATALYISNSQFVGINTPSPTQSLDVTGNAKVSNTALVNNLTATGTVRLGAVSSVSITGGTNGQTLITDGAGNLHWGAGGGGGGANLTVQYNSNTLTTSATLLNFTGNAVVVTDSGGAETITISYPAGSNPITVKSQGNITTTNAQSLNFTGNAVTVSDSGGNETITINHATPASALTVMYQGTPLTTSATSLNFVGNAVVVTDSAGAETITINSTGGGVGSANISILSNGVVKTSTTKSLNFKGNVYITDDGIGNETLTIPAITFGSGAPVIGHTYLRITCLTSTNASDGTIGIAEFQLAATVGGANQCTGGTPFASAGLSGPFGLPNAFDGIASTFWDGGTCPCSIGYQFSGPTIVRDVKLEMYNPAGVYLARPPTSFTVEYSDDGVTYTTLTTIADPGIYGLGELRSHPTGYNPPLPNDGDVYYDTTTTPWTLYVGKLGAWDRVGSSIAIKQSGNVTTSAAKSLNFTGNGVVVTDDGFGNETLTITGYGGGGGGASFEEQFRFAIASTTPTASFTNGSKIDVVTSNVSFVGFALYAYTSNGSGSPITGTSYTVPAGKTAVLVKTSPCKNVAGNPSYYAHRLNNLTTTAYYNPQAGGTGDWSSTGEWMPDGADSTFSVPFQVGVAGDVLQCSAWTAGDGHSRTVSCSYILALV